MLEADRERLRSTLRMLDDPQFLEHPAGHDWAEADGSFVALAARLESVFACTCFVSSGLQDASFHGGIVVPASANRSNVDIFVRVSNFGHLATYGLTAPGRHTADELAALLSPADRDEIEQELSGLGFVVVPEDLLRERYDGTVGWLEKSTRPSWFTRFFDYL